MVFDERFYGVVIEKGPADWQIIQQTKGTADIPLAGRLYYEPRNGSERIFARVVDENSGVTVVPYVKTEISEDGRWALTLRNVPAGGLYRIETCMRFDVIKEKRGDRIQHIGVGDLFVIAGQSNAVGVGKDSVYDPLDLQVHMLKCDGRWDIASHPLADSTNTAHPVNREGVQVGHSPWLCFARTVRDRVGYPIGLIPCARGGAELDLWDETADGCLYRNMLDMVCAAGGKVAGILWHQGCNDAVQGRAENYFERFCRVAASMRRRLGDDKLPIFTVQLNKATCGKNNTRYYENEWALLREAQRRAAEELDGVYMVPSADLTVCDGIHNSAASNLVIGQRVARQALEYLYGKPSLCEAPSPQRAYLSGQDEITVEFSHIYDHINTDLIRTEQFPLSASDADGDLLLTDYGNMQDSITLKFNRSVRLPAFVSCAHEMNPYGILPYDSESYLPLVSFYRFPVEDGRN